MATNIAGVPPSGSRVYNSVSKAQNGRKGQQSHQSAYYARGQINPNYMVSVSHDSNLRQVAQNNNQHLIKSYDSAPLQQQKAQASMPPGASGSNFLPMQQRESAN